MTSLSVVGRTSETAAEKFCQSIAAFLKPQFTLSLPSYTAEARTFRHTIGNSLEGLKDASWDLIELALALIRAAAESFDHAQPFRAEGVTRDLCEGFFLGPPTLMDTFKADSEQGIVDPLGYVSNVPDRTPATSS